MAPKKFGEIVRERRLSNGTSVTDFARQLSVTPGYVSNVEHGTTALPSFERIRQIAALLKINHDELLAAAGLVSNDVQKSITRRPKEMAPLIRTLNGATPAQIQQLAVIAGRAGIGKT